MKHPTSRMLHAYWDRLRGERAAPERSEIEPGAIRNLLADSLILEIAPAQKHATVRLAGTRICALFGRELRGAPFVDLWGASGAFVTHAPPSLCGSSASQSPWHLVETVAAETVGLVGGLLGYTMQDEMIELELLLLPLRHRGRTQARMLGALAPHYVPAWLGSHPIVRMESTSVRVLASPSVEQASEADPSETLPAEMATPANDIAPARRGHLLVHRGGRT